MLLDHDVPFHVHEVDSYWNDVGSLAELRQGTWDALEGRLRLDVPGHDERDGIRVGDGTDLPDDLELDEPPAWIGERCELGEGLRLVGPVAIGTAAGSEAAHRCATRSCSRARSSRPARS